jgi:hypothetical protein
MIQPLRLVRTRQKLPVTKLIPGQETGCIPCIIQTTQADTNPIGITPLEQRSGFFCKSYRMACFIGILEQFLLKRLNLMESFLRVSLSSNSSVFPVIHLIRLNLLLQFYVLSQFIGFKMLEHFIPMFSYYCVSKMANGSPCRIQCPQANPPYHHQSHIHMPSHNPTGQNI